VNVATTTLGSGSGYATANTDYATKSGIVTFAAGQTTATFTVTIYGDRTVEGNEVFGLALSGATAGATIATPSARMTIVDNDFAQMASSIGPGANGAELTQSAISALLPLAIDYWVRKGASRQALQNFTVVIGNLPGTGLGVTSMGDRVITLDINAAGWGWYTGTGKVPAGRIDLFTVLVHELGHFLGYHDGGTGIMAEKLSPGVRRVAIPTVAKAGKRHAKKPAKRPVHKKRSSRKQHG
jgi:Calx-beta domain